MTFTCSITVITIATLLGACIADSSDGWLSGSSTFYGSPTASGPPDNGGKCGFKNINLPPFNSLTSCGSIALWKDGKGCGSCYLMKCTSHPLCSGQPKLITITDECLYGGCADATYHFDMAGIAFGSLAIPGKELELHKAGKLAVLFKRVPCDYKGRNINFHVEEGSNSNYLAVLTEYQNGEGDLAKLEIQEAGSTSWSPFQHSWGKIWRLDSPHPMKGPFSLRVTTLSGKTIEAKDAIPADWKPNTKYDAKVNFKVEL